MAMTLITTNTSSGAATSSFTASIDSTYKLYIFKFIDINPATDNAHFTFQVNATDGADYNDSLITSSYFDVYHNESGATAVEYRTAYDQAQGTAYQTIMPYMGNGSDEAGVGELHLFNPSSTTYVKHFYIRTQYYQSSSSAYATYPAGYINDTTAIDDIQFKMSSGNFDGTIKMYGIK